MGISEILVKKELFDANKYQFIQAVVELEIENFLTRDEQKEICREVKMTPEAQSVVLQAIHEVNQKILAETEQKGLKEGLKEGMEKGIKKGRNDAMEEIARTLKNQMDIEELSRITGLSIERIQKL